MNNSNSQLVTYLPRSSISVQPKWLNKDRFWNFVFATLMTLGIFIASTIKDISKEFFMPSSVIFWLTLIGAPLLVRHFNKVSFVADKKFLTSEGREINVDGDFPSWFIVITIATTMCLGLVLDKDGKDLPEAFHSIILISALFFIPALCFSFKNCPISILFNLKFWQIEGNNQNLPYSSYDYKSSHSTSSNFVTNPVYGCLKSNIFNKYR